MSEHDAFQRVMDIPGLPRRPAHAHKGTSGRVALVAGSAGMSGAAVLAGLGALRGGAGLVRVFCARSVQPIVAACEPCLMTRAVAETDAGALAESAADAVLEPQWANVVALGPGLSAGAAIEQLTLRIAPEFAGPLVLDADGLNALAADHAGRYAGSRAAAAFDARRERTTIVTPHPGEFERLRAAAGLRACNLTADDARVQAAVEYAQLTGTIVVLKGHHTVVATNDRVYVNTSGNPGMATGGMGDVLTGLLAALLGQGLAGFDAARLGVFAHGRAADYCARDIAPTGYLAREVADLLPAAILEASQPRIGFR